MNYNIKAKIKVNKGSAYSHLNGQEFENIFIGPKFITVNIEGNQTDFLRKEVELVAYEPISGCQYTFKVTDAMYIGH